MSMHVTVNPDMLGWALERAGVSVDALEPVGWGEERTPTRMREGGQRA